MTGSAAPLCNAPNSNSDGNFLCNKEAGHAGDHVHSFVRPYRDVIGRERHERDFYWWPQTKGAAPGEGRTVASLLDELVHLAIATEGAYDRERNASASQESTPERKLPVPGPVSDDTIHRQVADDDTTGMAYIDKYARVVLSSTPAYAPAEHYPIVCHTANGYRIECECGWHSKCGSDDHNELKGKWQEHVRAAAPALEGQREVLMLTLLNEYREAHEFEFGCDSEPCDKCKAVRALTREPRPAGGETNQP